METDVCFIEYHNQVLWLIYLLADFFLNEKLVRALDFFHTSLYERHMTFVPTRRRIVRGRLKIAYEDRLIPVDVPDDGHFSLKVYANRSWPLISLETSSGRKLRSELVYNKSFAETGFVDADQFSSDNLMARVSMQAAHTGKFRLKLNDLGTLDDIRDNVIRFTNRQRRKEGLQKLKSDLQLSKAAQGHADDMDDVSRYLGHQSSDGRGFRERIDEAGYDWRSIRENVASGQKSARAVVQAWMKSPGHRENILSNDIAEIGIGFAVDDATGMTYWVQKFGAPI